MTSGSGISSRVNCRGLVQHAHNVGRETIIVGAREGGGTKNSSRYCRGGDSGRRYSSMGCRRVVPFSAREHA